MKKKTKIRLFITTVTIGVMTSLYLKESNLAYNVAQQRAILLGRYTLESIISLLILTIIAIFVMISLWGFVNILVDTLDLKTDAHKFDDIIPTL